MRYAFQFRSELSSQSPSRSSQNRQKEYLAEKCLAMKAGAGFMPMKMLDRKHVFHGHDTVKCCYKLRMCKYRLDESLGNLCSSCSSLNDKYVLVIEGTIFVQGLRKCASGYGLVNELYKLLSQDTFISFLYFSFVSCLMILPQKTCLFVQHNRATMFYTDATPPCNTALYRCNTVVQLKNISVQTQKLLIIHVLGSLQHEFTTCSYMSIDAFAFTC